MSCVWVTHRFLSEIFEICRGHVLIETHVALFKQLNTQSVIDGHVFLDSSISPLNPRSRLINICNKFYIFNNMWKVIKQNSSLGKSYLQLKTTGLHYFVHKLIYLLHILNANKLRLKTFNARLSLKQT